MMQNTIKPFKSPPKRFHPKGLTILYEDHDILVVDKVSGLLTGSTERVKDKTAYSLLTAYVKKGNPKSKKRIFIVHFLEKEISGVVIFAKNEKAKQYLHSKWDEFKKIYHTITRGIWSEKEGKITSYLIENRSYKMCSTEDSKKGKLASTQYKVLGESKKYSLLEIVLSTRIKHQIRVHFLEKRHPILGDKLYDQPSKGVSRLALHATTLTILHPITQEKMTFTAKRPTFFETLVKI